MGNPISNWYQRHQNPVNFWLHMPAIAACFVAAPIALVMGHYYCAAALFVGGYAVQFLGHFIEGNRSGEEMLIRRLFGKGDQ